MIYSFLKVVVSIAMKLFCRKIIINKPALLKENGPLLLACNHPNSFLDAVILDILFRQPVYSLARGDVFVNKWVVRILTAFKILPVYRLSEGANNLQTNYATFDECKKIFRKNGLVLIFSEGRCINEWHLRALKKGTARLTLSAWDENIPLKVLPVGINYSSFRRFGKTVHINFGEMLERDRFEDDHSDGTRIQSFNHTLRKELHRLVYEIAPEDIGKRQRIFNSPLNRISRLILFIPGVLGWLLHLPLYVPVRKFTYRRTNHNDHYDSVLMSLLLVLYPFYLLIISFLLFLATENYYSLSAFIVMPLIARAWIMFKPTI